MINLVLQNYLAIAIVLVLVLIIIGRIDVLRLAMQIKDVHLHLREYIKRYDNHFNIIFCAIADLRTKKKEGVK